MSLQGFMTDYRGGWDIDFLQLAGWVSERKEDGHEWSFRTPEGTMTEHIQTGHAQPGENPKVVLLQAIKTYLLKQIGILNKPLEWNSHEDGLRWVVGEGWQIENDIVSKYTTQHSLGGRFSERYQVGDEESAGLEAQQAIINHMLSALGYVEYFLAQENK